MAESDAMTARASMPFPYAMTARVSAPFTTNPPVATMAAGNLATRLRRFTTAAIVKPVEVAGHLRLLTDPRPHPARRHLFRRVAVVAGVVVAADGVNLFPTVNWLSSTIKGEDPCLKSNLLKPLNWTRN
jgi:hypothetical protein